MPPARIVASATDVIARIDAPGLQRATRGTRTGGAVRVLRGRLRRGASRTCGEAGA